MEIRALEKSGEHLQTSLHKGYGSARLYSLRRRQIEEQPAT